MPESNPSAPAEFLPEWPRVPGLQEGCSEARGECFGTKLGQKWSGILLKLTWLSTLPFKGSRIKQEFLISFIGLKGTVYAFPVPYLSCILIAMKRACHAAAVFGNFPADKHLVSKREFAGMSLPEYR